jgi:hypothetical protein
MENIKAKIVTIYPSEEFTTREGVSSKKIAVVIEQDDKYKNKLYCTSTGKIAEILDEKTEGDIVEIGYFVSSKYVEKDDKWFTNAVITFVK